MNAPRIDPPTSDSAPALAALAFFLVMTAYYIVRPVRDQLGGAVGASGLTLFWSATFVVMLLLTPVFGALVARFARRRLLIGCYGFFIACLLAFVPAFVAQDRIGARELGIVFYVWVSVFNLFVVSLFWSVMADVFTSTSARRVFPLIALGGMAGALAGPLITRLLVILIGVAPLLVVSAAVLAGALALLLLLVTRHDQRHDPSRADEAIGGSLLAGVKELWSRPFLRYMAILMLLGDGIGTLAYALVANYTKALYHDNVARTAFMADLDLATNLLGALLQLTATRWLLVRRGAGSGLVVPAVVNVLLLVVVMLAARSQITLWGTAVPLVGIMMVVTRGFAYGMTKPATDALYTRVPRETRYKGKNFVETAVWRFSDVVWSSSVVALAGVGVGLIGLAGVGAGASMLAVWCARRAGRSSDLLPESPAALPASPAPAGG